MIMFTTGALSVIVYGQALLQLLMITNSSNEFSVLVTAVLVDIRSNFLWQCAFKFFLQWICAKMDP